MLDSIRLPEEKEHYDKLRNWLAVDTILELMTNCGSPGNHCVSSSIPMNVLVTPITRSFGSIRTLLDEVVESLEMTQWEISFFLTADTAPLARSGVEITVHGEQAEIFLSTGLVELLTKDELKAVVAHELAHIFFGHHRITLCCNWLDLNAKQGRLFALANMYHYWRHLAEISADLASLQVTTSPRSAITSLARQNLRSLAPSLDMDLFLSEQKLRLEDGTLLQTRRTASHPPWEFRAIILDHCAKQPTSDFSIVSEWTEKLKVSPTDAYQFMEFTFLVIAGTYLVRADGAVHTAEINQLCDILARLLHAPEPQLLCLEKQTDCRRPMQDLGQELALAYPAKAEGIFSLLCSLVVQDGRIVSPEKEALADIATALHIPSKTASHLLLGIIRQDFHPVMPSIVAP